MATENPAPNTGNEGHTPAEIWAALEKSAPDGNKLIKCLAKGTTLKIRGWKGTVKINDMGDFPVTDQSGRFTGDTVPMIVYTRTAVERAAGPDILRIAENIIGIHEPSKRQDVEPEPFDQRSLGRG